MQPQICLGPHWVIHVILAIAACPVRPKSGLRLWCRPARQAHSEYRALSRLARYRHVAAHHARELAGDGQTEPGAAEALSGRRIGLAELLEQLGLLLRCHADAGVGDGELDEMAAIAQDASSAPSSPFKCVWWPGRL